MPLPDLEPYGIEPIRFAVPRGPCVRPGSPACHKQGLLEPLETYVGSWVRLYVFQPLARRIQRHTRTWRTAGAVATVLSFLCIGFLHDLYAMASSHRLSVFVTAWFAVNALVLLLWEAAAARLAAKPRGGVWKITERALVVGVAAVLAGALR